MGGFFSDFLCMLIFQQVFIHMPQKESDPCFFTFHRGELLLLVTRWASRKYFLVLSWQPHSLRPCAPRHQGWSFSAILPLHQWLQISALCQFRILSQVHFLPCSGRQLLLLPSLQRQWVFAWASSRLPKVYGFCFTWGKESCRGWLSCLCATHRVSLRSPALPPV